MVKATFKTLGLFLVFSFIFMYFYGFVNYLFNFLFFLTYDIRIALAALIIQAVYFVLLYILSKTEGYNMTGKLGFNKKAQVEGVLIGSLIYGILAFILAFSEKNLQNMLLQFFYNGQLTHICFYKFGILETSDITVSYYFTMAMVPFMAATRLWALFRGYAQKIRQTPAFESQNIEKVLVEQEIKKKSWKDSIKIDE